VPAGRRSALGERRRGAELKQTFQSHLTLAVPPPQHGWAQIYYGFGGDVAT